MKLLLTGFTPFDDLQENPSQLLVEALIAEKKFPPSTQVTSEILATEYNQAGKRIVELIISSQPDVILMLGVANKQSQVHLERVALNLDDALTPDNSGEIREGKKIVSGAPLAYFSNYPLMYLKKELKQRGKTVEISNHAGTYVCNHAFYCALHHLASLPKSSTLCGFVHIPFVTPEFSGGELGWEELKDIVVELVGLLRPRTF